MLPEGKDGIGKKGGRPYDDLRWSPFKYFAPAEMYAVVSEHVFPFLRTLRGDDSTYAHHMKDARFTIPTRGLLAKVVDLIAAVPMEDRDTKGTSTSTCSGRSRAFASLPAARRGFSSRPAKRPSLHRFRGDLSRAPVYFLGNALILKQRRLYFRMAITSGLDPPILNAVYHMKSRWASCVKWRQSWAGGRHVPAGGRRGAQP